MRSIRPLAPNLITMQTRIEIDPPLRPFAVKMCCCAASHGKTLTTRSGRAQTGPMLSPGPAVVYCDVLARGRPGRPMRRFAGPDGLDAAREFAQRLPCWPGCLFIHLLVWRSASGG